MFGRNIVVKPIYDAAGQSPAVLGQTLIVNSIWPTIQGEGPHAGCPAIFIRLTGCNLRCHFCDTEFEKGEEMDINAIVKKVKTLLDHCNTDLIVLTGGEPMRQQIIPALARFSDEGWYTQIETAGTVWPPFAWVSEWLPAGPTEEGMPPGRFVTLDELIMADTVQLVCSPKTPKIHAKIEEHCDHFKYIVRVGDTCEDTGLPIANTQTGEHSPKRLWAPDPDNVLPTIWLQPMTEYWPVRSDGQWGASEAGQAPVENKNKTRDNIEECVRLALKHGYRISLQQHRILGVD